jgi:hypothetical protein
MKITELLLAELDREAVGIRNTLEGVPEGKNDWKPHEIYCRSFPGHSFRLIPARQLALFFQDYWSWVIGNMPDAGEDGVGVRTGASCIIEALGI